MHGINTLKGRKLLFLVFIFFGLQSYIHAQCAGEDMTTELCSKEDNQFIDLFEVLGGSPTMGGTWSDDDNSGGLDNADSTDGMLNTYKITRGGVFHYTYTVNGDASCTDNTATVTLTLGSYAGLDYDGAVACDDNSSVSLFQFTGSSPNPTADGTWMSPDAPIGYSGGSRFDASKAGKGMYTFIYTVPAQGNCPEKTSTVELEVVPAPQSGTAENIIFCETQDFSGFRNYNLRSLLEGEDDDGAWSEGPETNEISRPGDPFINLERIRDNQGPGIYMFTYTVNPISPTCIPASTTISIEIEDVIDFSSAVFSITTPTADVCINDLPVGAKGQITVDKNEVPDGDYQLTYEVSPMPNMGTENITISFKDGVAAFDIDPDFIAGTGDVNVEIIKIIDPNTENNCQVSISGLTDTFRVTSLPDLSDTQVVIDEPICLGSGTTATLSDAGNANGIQLADGEYELSYTITGEDNATAIFTINVTNGEAIFELPLADQTAPGDYTFSSVSLSSGGSCITEAEITDNFTISPKPDAQSLTIAATDICENGDVNITITDTASPLVFINGTYSLSYILTGSNDTQATRDDIVFTDGKADFTINGSALASGETTISINSLQSIASSCQAVNMDALTTTFTKSVNPDLINADLTVAPVCEGLDVTAIIESNIEDVEDGTYTIAYSIIEGGTTTDYSAEATFSDGSGSFNIDPTAVIAASDYTLVINDFSNTNTGCIAAGLPLQKDFKVFANSNLDTATIAATPVCSGNDVTVNITGASLTDGDYKIIYEVTGANTLTDSIPTLSFVNGSASFSIVEDQLANSGKNTLSINSLRTVQTGCETTLSGVGTDFTINETPNLSTTILNYDTENCISIPVVINVADEGGNLQDGEYTLIYSISGANSVPDQSVMVTIASGSGSITIPADQLINPGNTSFTINSIANTNTSCILNDPGLNGTFNINALPDLASAVISVADFCEASAGGNVTVSAPNLADGDYAFMYTLSGQNTGSATAENVTLIDGTGTFVIDEGIIANTGETNITISSVSSLVTSCASEGLNIATTFNRNPTPQIENENLEVSSVCFGGNPTVSINNPALGDETYAVTYTLTGVNQKTAETVNITTVDGKASFDLDMADLNASGTTMLTITNAVNTTTSCSSTQTSSTVFEIYPIPTLADAIVAAMDICLNEEGLVTFDNASRLADTDYTVTYSLSGAVNASAETAQLTISGGKGNFTIPTALLNAAGTVTVNIDNLTSAEGCSSGTISTTATFQVLPLPDATGITVNIADYCIDNDVPVNISGAGNLADGDYKVTYELSGANTGNKTVDITFENGAANLTISANELSNSGSTTLTLSNVQNFIDLCGAQNVDNASASFEVQDPDPPTLATNGNVFCINDDPKISDLLTQVSPSTGLRVYASATDDVMLNENNTLLNGKSYFISVTNDGSGCESSVRLEVAVDLTGCSDIFIPDGFSPNGDGVNDTFEIENINIVYPNYTLEIFNRNGNVVYKGGAEMPAWDGHANQNAIGSKILPNGIYFYIINYNDGQTSPKQGKLYLNR